MRSIPLGLSLPQVQRPARFRLPQPGGLMRRSLVKTRLHLSRAAGMGMGTVRVRGLSDALRLGAGLCLKGARAAGKASTLALSGTAALGRLAARPLTMAVALAEKGAVAVGHSIYDYTLRHRARLCGRMAPMLLMMALTVCLFSVGFTGLALEVSLGDQPLGFVSSRGEVDEIIREVEARAGEYLGAPCVLTPDISYSLQYLDNTRMLDAEALKSTLFTAVSLEESGQYVLKVDGQIIGGATSKITLQNMLNRVMKTQSFTAEDMKTEFVQNVTIEPIGTSAMGLGNIAEMETLLTSNSMENQVYVVQSGDMIGSIAKRMDMSVREITDMNPGLNVDRISIGQEILISAAVPFVSLRQMRTEVYEESIPFETVIEYSDNMYTNQSKITKEGVPGLASVTADMVYVDGQVSDRDVLEYTVLQEPESQVKLVGTQKPPPKSATGQFIKPSNGKFSSGYGYRKNMRDNHTGVDWSSPTGSAIWASDGGVVTFADWKGSYGYCVIIDHGNGYQTLYAHCSTLLVQKGQKVAQGENIAKVGSTGRSTGPHVHLEIIKNGNHVNPLNYVGK